MPPKENKIKEGGRVKKPKKRGYEPKSPAGKKRVMERRRRRGIVRREILKGNTNVTELAEKLGVSRGTISKDMRWVFQQWKFADEKMFVNDQTRRAARVQQLMDTINRAVEAFEDSQEDAEKVVTHKVNKKCFACNGTGLKRLNGQKVQKNGSAQRETCQECSGKRTIAVVTETRETRGQAGDAAFLNVIRSCVRDIADLEGLRTTKHEHSGAVTTDLLIRLVAELENTGDQMITDDAIDAIAYKALAHQKSQEEEDEFTTEQITEAAESP